MTSRRPSSPRTRRLPLQVEPPAGIEPATPSLPFVCRAPLVEGAEVKRSGVSVVDRGEPEASCSEWHADGTAGEDDRAHT